MTKTLFHRSERDVTFEIHDTSKYIKVTVSNILDVESVFYISEEFIDELAQEVGLAKQRRIANQRKKIKDNLL